MVTKEMAVQGKTQPDQGGKAVDAKGQVIPPSELAERHRRTSKSRAPRAGISPRQKRTKSPSGEIPEQRELPFRRTRAVVSWVATDSLSTRIIRTGWIFALITACIGIMVFVYFYFAGSKFFVLRELDIQGNVLVTREEIESIVRTAVTKGVLRADLEQIRDKVNSNELVKEVKVTRLLPDMLRISITERDPYALARRSNGTVVCVDRQGVMFGNQSLIKSKSVLPVINGLIEQGERAAEINRQRMLIYQQLIADLDGSKPTLSSRIDEVYFDEAQGVRVVLADSRIAVFLGKEDFRMRLNAALDVLDAVKRRDINALNVLRVSDAEKLLSGTNISYVNATIPKRVVVGLQE